MSHILQLWVSNSHRLVQGNHEIGEHTYRMQRVTSGDDQIWHEAPPADGGPSTDSIRVFFNQVKQKQGYSILYYISGPDVMHQSQVIVGSVTRLGPFPG